MKASSRRARLKLLTRTILEDTQEHTDVRRGDLQRLWRDYFSGHRRTLLGVGFALAAVACVPYGFAMTHRYLIDKVLVPVAGGGAPGQAIRPTLLTGLWLVLTINLPLHTVNLVGNWLSSFLTLGLSRDIALKLREQLYLKLDALHMAYYDRTQSGRIVARVISDVGKIRNIIASHLSNVLVEPIRLIAGFIVLFWLNWRLAIILAVAAPVYAGIFLILRPRIRTNSTAESRLISRLYGLTAERLGAILVVKAMGRERSELGQFSRFAHNNVRLASQRVIYNQGLSLAAGSVSTLAVGMILLLGLLGVREGREGMTLGSVVAFVHLAQQVFQPIQTITAMAAMIQAGMVSLRRVFSLLDEPGPSAVGRISLKGMSGTLRFNEVTFRYPAQLKPALHNVSFAIQAGEHVAIMGPSGSGKSTLFNLLLRFYDPQRGRIEVGGVNLPDTDIASLRRHVRYVQQEPFVFSGTLAENIAYGSPNATEEAVIASARLVELNDFVQGLPLRYDTVIGENGMGLSGGQRQRLALATALLTNPEVLLLDDTTSALDAETEARIRQTLHQVMNGRTSLIITQRIATARDCDRIVVIEDGNISQQGTHQTLASTDGFYRRICEQQATTL